MAIIPHTLYMKNFYILLGLTALFATSLFAALYLNPSANSGKPCLRTGCNGEICTDRDDLMLDDLRMTICLSTCESECSRQHQVCKRVGSRCMFEKKAGFEDCIEKCKT